MNSLHKPLPRRRSMGRITATLKTALKATTLFATALCLACSMQSVHIDDEKQEAAVVESENKPQRACRLYLLSLHDARFTKAGIRLAGLSETDMLVWIRDELDNAGFQLSVPELPYVSIQVQLKRAHARINSESAIKSSNVVLGVRFGPPEAAELMEYFRGDDTSVNWSGRVSEIRNSLDQALGVALAKVQAAAWDRCSSLGDQGASVSTAPSTVQRTRATSAAE